MQLKQLFADEDAVSPVIGVILMVAITVILAAVIGTFVLGLGENVQDSAPQANFQFEYGGDWASASDTGTVTITHTGGEDVEESNVKIIVGTVEFDTLTDTAKTGIVTNTFPATISTGAQVTISEQDYDSANGIAAPSDTVRVVWTSSSGGTSNTIGQSTIPS